MALDSLANVVARQLQHGWMEKQLDAPNGVISILVINQSRDTAVWVELNMLFALLFSLLKVKVLGLVGQAELLEHYGDFPASRNVELMRIFSRLELSGNAYHPFGPPLCE